MNDAAKKRNPRKERRYLHLKHQQVPLAIRVEAVKQILSGKRRQIEVADQLGLRRQTVHEWVERARHGIPEQERGRPPETALTQKEEQKLSQLLKTHSPTDLDIDTPYSKWTWRAVRALAQRETGAHLHKTQALRLLQSALHTGLMTTARRRKSLLPPDTPPVITSKDLEPFIKRIDDIYSKTQNSGVRSGVPCK